jgi:beta-lactamase superfamily II metal-dependent hydrolase
MTRIAALLLTAAACAAAAQSDPGTLPPWRAGVLEIHRISTGKGDAVLFVFPDGTTMLMDPGVTSREPPRVTAQRPDASRTPGEWVVRYIRRALGDRPGLALDYALLTHFHGDHMGDITANARSSASGKYKLSGITEVADYIPVRTLIDRNWPTYDYPAPLRGTMMANYRAFLADQQERHGMRVERFRPGAADQIVLRRDADRYPDFQVRNVGANGEIWTGVGTVTRQHFPPVGATPAEDRPSENMCSTVFRMSYGKFDYYAGGDIVGIPDDGAPDWHDVETPVAKAVGPVDVAVLNHHGYIDAMNASFVSSLRPRVFVLSVWSPGQPGPRVFRRLTSNRLYPGPRDIFATNMAEANEMVVSGLTEGLASRHGHIVIRVEPGGASYRVFVLDDTSESGKVLATHGPYQSQ